MMDVDSHRFEANAERMPVLFVGHGSPMNAIEDNELSRGWRDEGVALPRPDGGAVRAA